VSIVDAHHHVWDMSVREQDWITADMAAIRRSFAVDDLRDSAHTADIEATVLVQTVPVAAEPDPDWLRRPDVIDGLRAVAGAGLAYDLLVRPHQLAASTHAAGSVPEMVFVLDHGGKPAIGSADLPPSPHAIGELAGLPNTTCKRSGLVLEAGPRAKPQDFQRVADVILSAFGPDRTMFGSDWPVCLLVSDYTSVVALAYTLVSGLSDAERTAVLAATAARVYGIAAPGRISADDQERGGGSWRLPTKPSTRSSR
jgi:L-fuconolactonase